MLNDYIRDYRPRRVWEDLIGEVQQHPKYDIQHSKYEIQHHQYEIQHLLHQGSGIIAPGVLGKT